MAASDILIKIESTFDVENLQLSDGRRFWPLLRHKIVYAKFKESSGYDNKLRTRSKKKLIFNFFSGFYHLFRLRKFNYFFFTNTDKRVPVRGSFFDIYFDAWADRFGQKECLFVEWAREKHRKESANYSSNVISDLPFKLAVAVVSRLMTVTIKDTTKFKKFQQIYGLPPSLREELKSQLAEIYVFKLLFKVAKPNAIFVLSSYSKIGIVIAAKELGIKVYEVQHGYIGDRHTFYSTEKKFKESYPDYLISFGCYEKKTANPLLIFSPSQIIPVGSFQLENIKSHNLSNKLTSLHNNYTLIFCVTLQSIKEEKLLNWVLRAAQENLDWLFIIRSRDNDSSYSNYTKQENITTFDEYTIYEILKISNFNITIFSTTAIEGIFLGATPIFFNINNLSRDHFDLEKMNAIVVEEHEQLNSEKLKKKINKENSFFIEDYLENVESEQLLF